MIVYKLVALALVFSLGTVRLCAQGDRNPSTTRLSLTEVLASIGTDHNCFFTVEDIWRELGKTHVLELESSAIPAPSRKHNLREELDELRKTIPNFDYQFDRNNPRIVHVIDTSLLRRQGYALDSRLKRINFTGTVGELLDVIRKQGVPLSRELVSVTSEAAVQDYGTMVTVKGTALNVREALSIFIPLEKRNRRIIWIARTRPEPGGISYIQFR